MRISIDIDGVLSQFCGQVTNIANKLWPGKVPAGYEPPDWYWKDIFNKKDWDVVWDVIRNTNNFWTTAEPYQDNVNALRTFLLNEKTDLFFITSRSATAGESIQLQTWLWMRDNRIPVSMPDNYSAIVPVPDSKKKRQVMEGLDIRFSVDDLGPTVEMCNQIPGHTAYVLDRPWNRDKDYGPRVKNLKEFLDIVKESK